MPDTNVTVDLEKNSRYRVAYDLMKQISSYENAPTNDSSREYFLTLYRQCYQVVYNGKTFDEVSSPKQPARHSGVFFPN